MGYNTTLLILNDRLSELEEHPKKFFSDLREATFNPFHHIIGQTQILSSLHSDENVAITVGQNTGHVIGRHTVSGNYDKDLEILKYLADKKGYKLVKK